MSSIAYSTCPKCAFECESESECQHCGLIFDRYKPSAPPPPSACPVLPDAEPAVSEAGWLRKSLRAIPWAMAVVMGVTVFLILQESPPLNARVDPDATQRVAAKMQELAYASDLRRPLLVELDEAELNAWLRSGLLHADRVGAQPEGSLRDIHIQLIDDHLRAHLVFAVVGTNLSLLLEGRVALADNHLRFLPTSGKLGSLPLPQAVLKNTARRVFEAPAEREKFLLPEDITRIEVRGGELVISSFR